MELRYLLIGLFYFSLAGCSSHQVVKEIKCPQIYRNGFSEVLSTKYLTIYNRDTISFNQIRFQCVHSALYTQKVLYDRFGKWDKEIYPKNSSHPILVWENVQLLSNGTKYNIMADGVEEWKNIYASVMVFDDEGNDILSDSSSEKLAITEVLADLIRNNDDRKREFYEIYWKMVDPKHWKTLKRYQEM